MNENTITLYPGNWLYNAGVLGLLKVLDSMEIDVKDFLKEDGTAEINIPLNSDKIFDAWDSLTYEILGISYKGKSGGTKKYYYVNQTERSIKRRIDNFLSNLSKTISSLGKKERFVCMFCGKKIRSSDVDSLKQSYSKILIGAVDNFYWNFEPKDYLCSGCQFVVMCHHLAFIKLSDGSEIFINAPSFKIMWYLNKYAEEIYSKEKIQTTKELLGISLIELASKLYIQLSKWVMMNIEVVSKFNNKIDFFVLPYETVLLLSSRDIASLLSDIGEFNILNLVLDGNYEGILELGERILNIALKLKAEKTRKSQDKYEKLINEIIKLQKNRDNKTEFSYKLFKLYSLIEEKLKGGILV